MCKRCLCRPALHPSRFCATCGKMIADAAKRKAAHQNRDLRTATLRSLDLTRRQAGPVISY